MLKIAVSDYYPAGPTLYVIPGAWCDTPGAIADGSSNGLRPKSSRRLRELFAAAVGAATGKKPAGPPSVSVNSGATCGLTGEEPVYYKVGDARPKVAERADSGAFKIALPNNLPDGETCVEVFATYDTARVQTSPDYQQWYQPLGEQTAFSRKVCLYKLTKQADATLTFDMCTSNKFTLNVSDITPLPVNVSVFDQPTDANLFRPLIKLWGGKVSELDGTPSTNAYDEATSRSEANYLTKFIPVPASYAGEALSFPLSDKLQEGYYTVSAVVSVVTEHPALTNLTGLNKITQSDKSGTAPKVTGLYEAASRMVHNATRVGVQKASTPTTLSAISSTSHGKGERVEPGDKIVLTWRFRGVGAATCTHDGAAVSNAPNGKCVSPLTVVAKDFGKDDTRHAVRVTFADVCGRVREADFEYTQAGVRTLSATEVVQPDGTVRVVGAGHSIYGSGAAAAARASGLAALASGALAALLLALAL